jgi:lipopolysaccharide/colanic/teichoic acid biosynthesis glycosyltransferase
MKQLLLLPLVVLGDIFFLSLSLFLAVFVRLQGIPEASLTFNYIPPFLIVFAATITLLYIFGFYDRGQSLGMRRAVGKLFSVHFFALLFEILLFYFVTWWGITPKTILLLYGIFSFFLLFLWRSFLFPRLFTSFPKIPVLYIGIKKDEDEEGLLDILGDKKSPYALFVVTSLYKENMSDDVFLQKVKETLAQEKIREIVIDTMSPPLSVYNFIAEDIKVHSLDSLYEEVFGKVRKQSLHSGESFLHFAHQKSSYEMYKKVLDFILSSLLIGLSLPLWLLAYVLIKLETGGNVLLHNNIRIGRGGKRIKVYKFRTMKYDDTGKWLTESDNKNTVTKVGYFLRKTRIDELPQLLNILKGELSLVGPRPDIVDLGNRLEKEIPFYKIRLMVTPGLSGWAQICMHKPPQTVEETKERLLYDLYYIKHRSFILDCAIALRTAKTLLSREGM